MSNVRAAEEKKKKKSKKRERETRNTRWQILETGVAMVKKWLLYTPGCRSTKFHSWKKDENVFQGSWTHKTNAKPDTWSIVVIES